MSVSIVKADCLEWLRALPADSLDLVVGSPPYARARLYLEDGQDLGIARDTDEWVSWMADVHEAAQSACRGLVAFVVAGQTRDFRWSAGPALLMAELHRRGLNLRNPLIFHRVGIPGSGGPDWLRNDTEWIVCTSRPGKLPWSDNTICGHSPKGVPGGSMSYRDAFGNRKSHVPRLEAKRGDLLPRSRRKQRDGTEPKVANATENGLPPGSKFTTKDNGKGEMRTQLYVPPEKSNPGNVIECGDVIDCVVGGGVMGNPLCHVNEAPYPEKLAEFFILSFCKPGGIVCDPFSGSGTTAAVAVRHGRSFTGCDLRQSQVNLGMKRVAMETPLGLFV